MAHHPTHSRDPVSDPYRGRCLQDTSLFPKRVSYAPPLAPHTHCVRRKRPKSEAATDIPGRRIRAKTAGKSEKSFERWEITGFSTERGTSTIGCLVRVSPSILLVRVGYLSMECVFRVAS